MLDQFVLVVDADVVFVAVVVLTILLRPPRLNILLPQLGRILFPILRCLTFLDLGVLFPAVALAGRGYQAGINDLALA